MNDGDAGPVDWSQFYRPRQSPAATSTEPTMPSGSRSRPARKRSRASSRAPTTLLNTDPSNFRAMVQQFTGGPSAAGPYMPAGPTTLNFGIGFHSPASQSPAVTLPCYGVQQNQYQYQRQQQQQQEEAEIRYILPQHSQYGHPSQQQEINGFGIGENIEDDRHQAGGLGLPEEFFLDGIGGQRSENNRGGGYFL